METDKLIFKPEIRSAVGELKKHTKELGKRFVLFDKNNLPEGDIYMIARKLINVSTPYEAASPRKHSVNSYMIFFGSDDNLGGMTVEITLDSSKYIYETPVNVFIPAGTLSSYKIIHGSGIYMKLVVVHGGDYNSVTE